MSKPHTLSTRILAGLVLSIGLMSAAPVLAVDSPGGDGGSSGGGGGGGSSSSGSESSGPSLADARSLIKHENWKGAISTLKSIVAADPGNADALNLLGYSLRKSGDMKNALGFYEKALKINPRHKGAHEYLGELYVETGHMDKAKAELATLEQLCGNTSCEEYEDLEKAIAGAS